MAPNGPASPGDQGLLIEVKQTRCRHAAISESDPKADVEHNYRMILVSDGVAEVSRDTHESELKTMNRIFADVKTPPCQ